MSIKYFGETGRFWEIFGFSDDSFNSIQLSNKYCELLTSASLEDTKIIDAVFSVLNAPISRRIYLLCRKVMAKIEHDTGRKFKNKEREFWGSLWSYCSNGWREPTQAIVDDIKAQTGLMRAPTKPKEKSQQELVQELADLIKALDNKGLDKNQIAEVLTKQGIPFTTAIQFVESYHQAKKKSQSGCLKSLAWWIIVGLIIWGISTTGVCDDPSSNRNTNYTPPPKTTYVPPAPIQIQGTGTVTGKIYFSNGAPATTAEIYLFKPSTGFSNSYKGTRANASGAYTFTSVAIGTYEVYVTTDPNLKSFTGLPDATIKVTEYLSTYVPNIYVK